MAGKRISGKEIQPTLLAAFACPPFIFGAFMPRMPFRKRPKREPDLKRVKRWLERTGILDDLKKAEKKFRRNKAIGAASFEAPDLAVATLRVLIRRGLVWPSERGLLTGQPYNPLLIRPDLKNIRTVIRAQLEEIPRRSQQLNFLHEVKNLAEEELKVQQKDLQRIEREGTKAEKIYHARVINLLRGIADTCERMHRLLSSK